MQAGGRRVAVIATGVAALVVIVASVALRGPGGEDRSDDAAPQRGGAEADAAPALPEGLTPPDPAHPNPTGDDPLAIGAPPEVPAASTAEGFLARAEQIRASSPATVASPPKVRPGEPDPGPQPDDGTLLVTFAPDTSDDAVAAALRAAGVSGRPIDGTGVVEVATEGQDHAVVAAALEADDAVESVAPNLVRRAGKTPNDPEVGAQAHLETVRALQAWEVADTRASVVVAVLDTGVDRDHPDLAPNLVAGYDAVHEDADPADDNGHGTQVAGVVGAATGNGSGVAGVAWNAKIMPVKVLDAAGRGTDADIAQGIVWATDHGARIINLSLGGPGASDLIDNAVDYALQREVVLVAAAGNASSQALFYPAGAPGVLGVTATDSAGQFASFSNHGPWYLLAAPGIAIRTTAMAAGPGAAYTSATGTSFSSPIVAGVAALLSERHPGWGWFEVADELVRTARDAGPAGVDDAYGFGIVDAAAALGVGPLGATSQPVLTGDAGNVPSAARAMAAGAIASESIGYEYDEDWFAVDVPAAAGATVTVTPPAASDGTRAAEMDPVVELYGPGGGLLARVDDAFEGELEELRVNVAPGRHTVRVTNYGGSAGPGAYTVEVNLGERLPPDAWAPPQTLLSPGGWEEAVAVADFNDDGRDDVAMATGFHADEENDYKIFVLSQAADGTLGAPVKLSTHATYPAHGDPLRAVDIDGDGDIDLVRGTASGLDVAWNDGTGLTEPVLYPAGGPVAAIQSADLDGSAPDELVVQGGGPLQVLSWNATQFAAESLDVSPTVAATGIAFDVADLTGDGRPDIVAFEGNDVTIRARLDDGGWAPPAVIALGARVSDRALVAADISSDGRPDIVAVRDSHVDGARLTYRLQQADGSFGPAVSLPTAGGPGSVRIADVTADGRNDVAVLHHGGSSGVYRQTADGALAPEEDLGGMYATWHYSPDSLSVGDLDGDGANDLAVASYNYGLYVHRHQASSPVEASGPWLAGSSPAVHAAGVATSQRPTVTFGRDVAASSVSGDTVFLVDGRDGRVVESAVSRAGRTVTLSPISPLRPGVPYQVWVAGVTDPTGTDAAYLRIPFTTAGGAAPAYNVGGTYVPVRVDLDGNGYDDIFWYGPGAATDSVWFFGPDGRESVTTSIGGSYTPVAGDFDGNGYEDIYWYAPGAGTDVMWWNSWQGIVPAVVQVRGVYVPTVGDFDRNGYDDIFWYGPGSTPDSVWAFGPAGHRAVTQVVNGTSYRPVAGDVNRDGYDDIVWHGPGAVAEGLWQGIPTGFRKGSALAVNGSYRLRALDAEADGFDEVFLYATGPSGFWRNGPSGFTSVQAGPSVPTGARPVTGEFTGDLRDDLFVYVPGATADRFRPGSATGIR